MPRLSDSDMNIHFTTTTGNFGATIGASLAGMVAGAIGYYAYSHNDVTLLGLDVAASVAATVAAWYWQRKQQTRSNEVHALPPKEIVHNLGDLPSADHAHGITFSASELVQRRQQRMQQFQEQANFINTTLSSLQQLTSVVEENALNVQSASKLASTASDAAAEGGSAVSAAVGTMNKLSESARKIAEITTVIDSIAFQTNILALNAAVEAARAGDQGKGFAVVATEVRNLAHRSADAAKEIKNLIQSSVTQIDSGADLVNQAGKTMQDVVGSVNDVTTIMQNIARDTASQSAEVGSVTQAVRQMKEATNEGLRAVETEINEAQIALHRQEKARLPAADDAAIRTQRQQAPSIGTSEIKQRQNRTAVPASTATASRAVKSERRMKPRTPVRVDTQDAARPNSIISPIRKPTTPANDSNGTNENWVEF